MTTQQPTRACVIDASDLVRCPDRKAPREVLLPLERGAGNGIWVRPIAVGVCFSDAKMLMFGVHHRRAQRGISANGVIIPGHEICCEVLARDAETDFEPGDVLYIHPRVVYQGRQFAVGFDVPGGLAEAMYVDERLLCSDEGGNVIRCPTGLAPEALALTEPWSCVEADFAAEVRSGPDPGSPTVVLDLTARDDVGTSVRAHLRRQGIAPRTIRNLLIAADRTTTRITLDAALAKHASVLVTGGASALAVEIDLFEVHYRGLQVQWLEQSASPARSGSRKVAECYRGCVVLFGGGGPLGQMYLRRLLLAPDPPAAIIVVDRSASRLQRVSDLATAWATVPTSVVPMYIPAEVTAGSEVRYCQEQGCPQPDAVISFVPMESLYTSFMRWVSPGGLVNVFAGIPCATFVAVHADDLIRGVRLIGRSGSSVSDGRVTLAKLQSREIDLQDFVAAEYDLDHAWDALLAVRDRRHPGKVLVRP